MEKDKYEFIESSYSRLLNNHEDYSAYGCGDYAFYITFINEEGNYDVQEVLAASPEEAIGCFLMEHSKTCYDDILDMSTEDEVF